MSNSKPFELGNGTLTMARCGCVAADCIIHGCRKRRNAEAMAFIRAHGPVLEMPNRHQPANLNAPIVMSNVQPIRAPKGAPEYRMTAKGNRGTIYLYGLIGVSSDNFFGIEGITAKQFATDLKNLGAVTNIDLRINSDGGIVDDARAIYNLLIQHPATVATRIDSIAASAASLVAMAGRTIEIAQGGHIMIHNVRGGAYGTADEVRARADVMDGYNQAAINTYAARTKNKPEQIAAWMDDETWFNSEDAMKFQFVDSVSKDMEMPIAAIHRPDRFKNMPTVLRPNRAAAMAALDKMKAPLR